METMTFDEMRRVIKNGLERGWIRPPENPGLTADDIQRNLKKLSMRRARGKAEDCVVHEPNINGYCFKCGRKVNSIHSTPSSNP